MTQTTQWPKVELGKVITEGKTKVIQGVNGHSDLVVVKSKDDITAGDGAKHDTFTGKAVAANTTACNVFRFLKECGVPTAFVQQASDTSFLAHKCTMLPYEVVVRRVAMGSYCKRHPYITSDTRFSHLVVELFLKTSNKRWGEHKLVKDDPLMMFSPRTDELLLYHPGEPSTEPFCTIPTKEVFGYDDEWKIFEPMQDMARRIFLCLERAWQLNDGKLIDFKLEFGFNGPKYPANLVLSDVVDNDSWRVLVNDKHVDKQVYRDGGSLESVKGKYTLVANITKRFKVPKQKIVLWRASESDNLQPFRDAMMRHSSVGLLEHQTVTCSAHKSPERTLQHLRALNEQDKGNTIIITYVGRSNGLGPLLAAKTSIPVITVPAGWRDFPNDVWSSLRTPSNCPANVILEPSNAAHSAFTMLAQSNPALYADIQLRLESQDMA